MISKVTTALALIGLAACSAPPLTTDRYLHSLNVQWNGKPWSAQEVDRDALSVIPRGPVKNFSQQIDLIRKQGDYEKAGRVLVFVHGGLNTLTANQKRTDRVLAAVRAWNKSDDGKRCPVYPILINWHSGFRTYFDRLFRIRGGRASWWAIPTAPFAFVADLGRAAGRLPFILFGETRSLACRITGLGAPVHPPPLSEASWPKGHISIEDTHGHDLWWYAKNGVGQVVPGLARVVTLPLADLILYESYQLMLRRLDMLFRTEEDYVRSAHQGVNAHAAQTTNGALAQLIRALETDKKAVTLVGHSLGCIAINEIVQRHPRLDAREIVYMAAACTSKEFIDSIPAYLEQRARNARDTQFYSLCLHPSADVHENMGRFLIPTGSLLEYLDAYVHRVKTPMDLCFGKWNNAMAILPLIQDLPPAVKQRIHIKGFPVRDTAPIEHSDFTRSAFWDPHFWQPTNFTARGLGSR